MWFGRAADRPLRMDSALFGGPVDPSSGTGTVRTDLHREQGAFPARCKTIDRFSKEEESKQVIISLFTQMSTVMCKQRFRVQNWYRDQ